MIVNKKVVIVGDEACGKTSLLSVIHKQHFPDKPPTCYEGFVHTVELTNYKVNLAFWDTPGSDEYSKLRPLSYRDADVFLVSFSLESEESFRNAINKWIPEIINSSGDRVIKIIFVGLKMDIAKFEIDENHFNQIENLDGKIVMLGLLVCSAKNKTGVNEIVNTIASATTKKSVKFCVIL